MQSKECSSRAELAHRLGLSRARVTQVLRLFKLTPEAFDVIAALGDPLLAPVVTERTLRPIVDLPAKEQTRKIKTILSGHRGRRS